MSMSPRHLLSATLVAIALVGCSPTSGSGDTNATVTNVDANQVGSIFDDSPKALDQTAWKMPTAGLFFYDDTATTAYAWSAAANAQARPGASAEDLTVDYSVGSAGQSDVSYQPSAVDDGSGDTNFGVIEADDSSGGWSGLFARSRDNAIFAHSGSGWQQHLPASAATGTSWQSDRGLTGRQVFAYKTDGTVAHTPRVRLDASNNAVDSNGNATSDATKAMIDYTTGTAYVGAWVNVRRVAYNNVLATNATSPNGITGCIQVGTTYAYRLVSHDSSLTLNVGLDQFSGSSTWYWKPGRGVVHESVTETMPQKGFWLDSARNSEGSKSGGLASYNSTYDDATFGTPVNYTTKAYHLAYQRGFTDGYKDISIVSNPTNRTTDLNAAVQAEWPGFTNIANDSNDDGYSQGFYAAFQAGYAAGFSAGGADWDADYNAVANGPDTAKAGNNGPDTTLLFRNLPAAYRYDGMQAVSSLGGIASILAGTSDTGGTYANGYDGLGEYRTAYDSTITVDLSKLKPAKDVNNQDKTRMIKLPAMGRNTTVTTVRVQTDQPIPDGNG